MAFTFLVCFEEQTLILVSLIYWFFFRLGNFRRHSIAEESKAFDMLENYLPIGQKMSWMQRHLSGS